MTNNKNKIIREVDFHKWKGVIERTPDYYQTKGDLKLNGVPEYLWEKLAEEIPVVKDALAGNNDPIPEEKVFPQIKLPNEGKLISEFAEEVAIVVKDKQDIFYRPSSKEVLEICLIKEKDKSKEYLGFSGIKADRFITLAENHFEPGIYRPDGAGGYNWKKKSMSASVANVVLASSQLQEALPKVYRIFPAPLPIIHDDELTFPKRGYDERFGSFMPSDAPEIDIDMEVEEAKEIIKEIYKEFCFQDRQDYINAIAALLTPFLRGLFPKFCERTPVWVYTANRERAGKDYCRAVTALVHEGYSLEEPPISSGEKSGNNNEELRKKLLSAFLAGRRMLHFANNKGYVNNAVFEGVITSEKYSDRALGRNEILNFDNELEFSLSGNVGIGFTPDLINRAKFIRLFLDIEDANAREFEQPNLHGWVKDNRSKILSALYALVRNWFEAGKLKGSVPFASFPVWAEICGGIMEAAGYESPCVTDKEVLAIGGDSETRDMKGLFEFCYEKFPDKWISKKEIVFLISGNDDGLFPYLDFNKQSDKIKFGVMITKFTGRILGDVILKVKNQETRASRQEFMFTKNKPELDKNKIFGRDCRDGRDSKPTCERFSVQYKGIEPLPTLPTLPKKHPESKFTDEELKKMGYSDEEIKDLLGDFRKCP